MCKVGYVVDTNGQCTACATGFGLVGGDCKGNLDVLSLLLFLTGIRTNTLPTTQHTPQLVLCTATVTLTFVPSEFVRDVVPTHKAINVKCAEVVLLEYPLLPKAAPGTAKAHVPATVQLVL